MEYYLGFIIYSFLFLSLTNINDTADFFSPCTNKSLENSFPVVRFSKESSATSNVAVVMDGYYAHSNTNVTSYACVAKNYIYRFSNAVYSFSALSFCKESISASNVAIVLDGYYAHSLTNVTTCACVAKSHVGQIFEFMHANFGNGIGLLPPSCGSEIRVSNSKSAGFIMSCSHLGSLSVDDNGEITVELRKLQTTADTRYCILVRPDPSSNFSITCEGNRADVTEMRTTMSTTTLITTTPDTMITTTYDTYPETTATTTTVSVLVSTSDKSTTGLIVSAAIGWCFGFVFVVTTIILLYQRRNYMKMMKEKTYDELHTRDARNYRTIGESNMGGQEYEIVTGNI